MLLLTIYIHLKYKSDKSLNLYSDEIKKKIMKIMIHNFCQIVKYLSYTGYTYLAYTYFKLQGFGESYW